MTDMTVWQPRNLGTRVATDLLPFGGATSDANALSRSKDPKEEIVSRQNVESTDLVVPSLMLLQKMSQAIDRKVPGAEPGMFMLSTTEEVFLPPIRALVVFFAKSRALFPKPERRDLQTCISRDCIEGTTYGFCEQCPHRLWGGNNEPPLCSESMNFVLWLPQGPAIIRFARQGRKSARNFLSQVTLAQQNFWAAPVIIGVETRTKTLQGKEVTYWLPTIKWDIDDPVPAQLRANCRTTYDGLHAAFESGKLKEHGVEQDEAVGDDDPVPY